MIEKKTYSAKVRLFKVNLQVGARRAASILGSNSSYFTSD